MADTESRREIGLQDWLSFRRALRDAQGQPARLLLGGTGHLLLSDAEQTNATAHLTGRVLPDIARHAPEGGVTLVTGAAPGADMLFHRTATEWFRSAGVSSRNVAMLPVPPNWLIEDWCSRVRAGGRDVSPDERAAHEEALTRLLEDSNLRVRLYEPEEAEQLASRADWRDEQYRRLAAVLAQHSDLLIAVLRASNLREPGGTAEVVAWRRQPGRVPERFSTLSPEDPQGTANRHPLIVIDPAVPFAADTSQRVHGDAPVSAEEQGVLDAAAAAMRAGNDLRCHDLVARAIKRGLRSTRMEYLRIHSLANVGNTRLALEQYRGLHLSETELDEDWLALNGRLEKDLAALGGEQAATHYRASAEAYEAAYRQSRGYYSGINAATMHLLAGDEARAKSIAAEVRTQLRGIRPRDETEAYFLRVTAAEAHLLLGEVEACSRSLWSANRLLPNDVVRRGRTVSQLRLLCAHLDVDPAVLDTLERPPVILLRREDGITGEVVKALVPIHALVFFNLVSPNDLELAQALLRRGARIYPTVAADAKELQGLWRRQWGEASLATLNAVLDRAERVATAPGFLDDETAWRERHLFDTSLGSSLLSAQRLGCEWRVMALGTAEDGSPRLRARGRVADVQRQREHALQFASYTAETNAPTPERRRVGILFADFAGFRRIHDQEMTRFWQDIMAAMGGILGGHAERVLYQATWGDALHVITADALTAAQIAADIQTFIERCRQRAEDPLAELELRIAAHYAPAFAGWDPIRRSQIYYGSQLSFAARIEPVTPPGLIFGSEAFVARLTLEAPERFAADYVGQVELAKNFGTHRLFAVQRRGT